MLPQPDDVRADLLIEQIERLTGMVGERFVRKAGPRRLGPDDRRAALVALAELGEALAALEPLRRRIGRRIEGASASNQASLAYLRTARALAAGRR